MQTTEPVVSTQVPCELQLLAAHFAPASTAASLPPELLLVELVELVDELLVEVVPDDEVAPDELDVPASVSVVVPLSPQATATIPTISPVAIPTLRMVVTLFLVTYVTYSWDLLAVKKADPEMYRGQPLVANFGAIG